MESLVGINRQALDAFDFLAKARVEALSELSEGERLFAGGWLAKARATVQEHPGEGIAWDAPGYTPPR